MSWARLSASWRRSSADWERASAGWERAAARWSRLSANPFATPQRAFPAGLAAWVSAFPSVPAPAAIWTMQESASPIEDQVGTADLVQNQALLYAQAGETEPTLAARLALQFDSTATTEWAGPADAAVGDIALAQDLSFWLRFRAPDNGATLRSIFGKGDVTSAPYYQLALNATSGTLRWRASDTVTTITATHAVACDDNAWHDALVVFDSTGSVLRIIVDDAAAVETSLGLLTAVDAVAGLRFGAAAGAAVLAGTQISYAAMFDAALTQTHLTALRAEV